jgi:hypothetical protein
MDSPRAARTTFVRLSHDLAEIIDSFSVGQNKGGTWSSKRSELYLDSLSEQRPFRSRRLFGALTNANVSALDDLAG